LVLTILPQDGFFCILFFSSFKQFEITRLQSPDLFPPQLSHSPDSFPKSPFFFFTPPRWAETDEKPPFRVRIMPDDFSSPSLFPTSPSPLPFPLLASGTTLSSRENQRGLTSLQSIRTLGKITKTLPFSKRPFPPPLSFE